VLREEGNALGASKITELIHEAGLDGMLASLGHKVTFFAPSDEALAKLDETTIQMIAKQPDALKRFLFYHIVPGTLDLSKALTSMSALWSPPGKAPRARSTESWARRLLWRVSP